MKAEQWREKLCQVLERPLLSCETVIGACGKLSDRIVNGNYGPQIQRMGLAGQIKEEDLLAAAEAISADVLSARVRRELGETTGKRIRFPLGILLHFGAGNVAGLGAYSVVEGLLAGNINLLKPSSSDGEYRLFC